MAGPGPLGVAQALDEGYGVVCQFLVVGRRFGFEFGGFVLFQFPHGAPLLLKVAVEKEPAGSFFGFSPLLKV